MKKTILIISLIFVTLFISGCEENSQLGDNVKETNNKLDCKVNAGFEKNMEGDRYIFTFVDDYATEKEVSKEFDTKEEAKEFYDSVSSDSANILDGKRVYYVQKVPEGKKYTREDVKTSMEKQNCTCN